MASLQAQVVTLCACSYEVVIEAFKASPTFEQLQLDFARITFEVGKLHIWRVAAAERIKLGDLARWAVRDQYSSLSRQGHALVPYNSKELEDIKKVDDEEQMPTWVSPSTLSPNITQILFATREEEEVDFDPATNLTHYEASGLPNIPVEVPSNL